VKQQRIDAGTERQEDPGRLADTIHDSPPAGPPEIVEVGRIDQGGPGRRRVVALVLLLAGAFATARLWPSTAAPNEGDTLARVAQPSASSPGPVSTSRSPGPTPEGGSIVASGPASVSSVFPEDRIFGRQRLRLLAVTASFDLAPPGWAGYGDRYFTKNIQGSQAAEAVVFMGTVPTGEYDATCDQLLGDLHEPTAASLATVMSATPGAVVTGPQDVAVGGWPARYLSLEVREDHGCDPGYFFVWPAVWGGALWVMTAPGAMVQVWLVEVDSTLVVVEAITTDEATPELEAEIQAIVDSIRFD
jgi:hypothetical protein